MSDLSHNLNLISGGKLQLESLAELMQKPEPFAPGEPLFWDDPHISKGMLAAHLSPETEAASRPPDEIAAAVDWLWEALKLKPGDTLLDLGCGPGLYATQFAQRGAVVTGLDYSRRSLDYARQKAEEDGLSITYRYQDFLTLAAEAEFDVVMQIYGELNVFGPDMRDDLLRRIRRALKPGGKAVFDVTTPVLRNRVRQKNGWYVAETGFWKPGPHLVLEMGFDYEDIETYLSQVVVIEDDGAVTVYRNWFMDYVPETITPILEAQGFSIEALWGNLKGTPYAPDSEWLGIVAV